MPFSVDVHTEEHCDVVTVVGELDLATCPHLRDVIRDLIAEGRTQLVIDLSRLTFIDSTGLSVLIAAHQKIRAMTGSLALVCNARCTKLLRITRMDRVFACHQSRVAAVASLTQRRTT